MVPCVITLPPCHWGVRTLNCLTSIVPENEQKTAVFLHEKPVPLFGAVILDILYDINISVDSWNLLSPYCCWALTIRNHQLSSTFCDSLSSFILINYTSSPKTLRSLSFGFSLLFHGFIALWIERYLYLSQNWPMTIAHIKGTHWLFQCVCCYRNYSERAW